MPKPGELVCGKYRVVRCVKSGGQGAVYEAIQLNLDRRVALKVIHRGADGSAAGSQDPQAQADRERFVREAKALARLSHPNIAQIFDFDMSLDGEFCLVMEFLDGRDLRRELTKRGTFRVAEAVGYILQACAGVGEAHRHGIVHRDIKPHNLFLTNLDADRVIKLVDFGLAKTHADASITASHAQPGTPLYMAPELYAGTDADARSDLWALGTVLHELLAGTSPFKREGAAQIMFAVLHDSPPALSELRSDVPRELDAVVARCLAKQPEDRFQTVGDLSAALLPFGPPSGIVHLSLPVVRGSSIPPPPDPDQAVPLGLEPATSTVSAVTSSSRGAVTARTVVDPPSPRPRRRRPRIYAIAAAVAAVTIAALLLRLYAYHGTAVSPAPSAQVAAARPEPAPSTDPSAIAAAASAAPGPAAAASSSATSRRRPAPAPPAKPPARPRGPDRLPLHL